MSWLGVDIGTSACKAALFDDHGQCLAEARQAYPLLCPEPGAGCLDPRTLMLAWRKAIAQVVADCPQDPPRALSISSQGEAVMLLDTKGEPLAPVLTSLDSRPAAAAQAISERLGREELYARSGHTIHAMFSVAKLAWYRSHLPDIWSRVAAIHTLEDMLQRDLGVAAPSVSWSSAGRTMLFAVRRHCWDEALCAAIDLNPALLPRCAPSGTIAGTVSAARAAVFGLPAHIPVVCGGHDQGMGALGAGVYRPGEALYATGTIECICPALDHLQLSPSLCDANLCSYDFPLPGLYTTVAFSLTGGNALAWFRSQFAAELPADDARAFAQLYASLPTAPSDLLCLPYFAPSGTPYFHPRPLGALFGLHLQQDRGTVLKGILEGIALEMRLNLDILARNGLAVQALIASGGAARVRASTQLKADVLGRPVASLAVAETGCLGAAMLAAAAANNSVIASVQADMRPHATWIEPDTQRAAHYTEQFARYQRLYTAVQDVLA